MLRQTAQGCIRRVLKTSQDRDCTASLSNLLHCLAAITWKSFSFYQVGTCPIPVYDLCVLFPSHAPSRRARLHLLEALPAGFGRGCFWVPLKLPLVPPAPQPLVPGQVPTVGAVFCWTFLRLSTSALYWKALNCTQHPDATQ